MSAMTASTRASDPVAALRQITVLVLALGGEGGGVLADWLVDTAIAAGFPVQGTSVPGVAQRTGATSYYIELLPVPQATLQGREPVFCLSPTPGQIDLLVSSELLETGRALERGLADPQRTVLVSSTSRFLTVAEKSRMGDGRLDDARIVQAAREASRHAVLFDMAAATQSAGTVISAVMFGAIAGSGVLPLSRAQCEATVAASGRGAQASLRGFAAGFEAVVASRDAGAAGTALPAQGPGLEPAAPAGASGLTLGVPGPAAPVQVPAAPTSIAAVPVEGVALPGPVAAIAELGVARLREHQDAGYAGQYLDLLGALVAAETSAGGAPAFEVSVEAARTLAGWMAYEDVIRVADLKSRAARFARIRAEVGAAAGEPVIVRDFLKPGVDEIAAILPPSLAARLEAWGARRGRTSLSDGLRLATSSVHGLMALRMLAALRPLRRRSSRFLREQASIRRWHDAMLAALACDRGWARELAECPRLLKGYGDTFVRGQRSFEAILAANARFGPELAGPARAAAVRAAREAALADPQGQALARVLGLPPPIPVAQPVRIVRGRARAGQPGGGRAS